MRNGGPYDVCAAVVSDLPFDARVWKQARSLAAAGHRVAVLGCRYDTAELARRHEGGIDVLEIPFGFRDARKSTLGRLAVVARLWLEILRTPARAYHSHDVHVGPPAWLASRLRGAALIFDAHEIHWRSYEGSGAGARILAWASTRLERFMVKRSDAVITTNPSRAAVLSDHYGVADVTVLANVPARVDDVVPLDPGYPADAPVLLYQGWITPEARSFRETIQALRLLDGVHFVVVGFGHEHNRVRVHRWAAEEGLSDRVHLLPPRPFDELVRTAAAATVGLVPIKAIDLNTYLGDTNKLHEYLMAGLPVVGSDLPEIRRVVAEGDPPVGETFDPLDPTSIAAAVRRVLEDTRGYEARRREARRLALERFNWHIEERRLLGLYERFLDVEERAVEPVVSA
jgi:glycosyltransferase involved in cell wall biosynthesis